MLRSRCVTMDRPSLLTELFVSCFKGSGFEGGIIREMSRMVNKNGKTNSLSTRRYCRCFDGSGGAGLSASFVFSETMNV